MATFCKSLFFFVVVVTCIPNLLFFEPLTGRVDVSDDDGSSYSSAAGMPPLDSSETSGPELESEMEEYSYCGTSSGSDSSLTTKLQPIRTAKRSMSLGPFYFLLSLSFKQSHASVFKPDTVNFGELVPEH